VHTSVIVFHPSKQKSCWTVVLLPPPFVSVERKGERSRVSPPYGPRNTSPPGYLQTAVLFLNLSYETAVVPWSVLCSSLLIRKPLFVALFCMYRTLKSLLCHAKSFHMAIVHLLPDVRKLLFRNVFSTLII